jgi:hypothetical protein
MPAPSKRHRYARMVQSTVQVGRADTQRKAAVISTAAAGIRCRPCRPSEAAVQNAIRQQTGRSAGLANPPTPTHITIR